MPYQGDEKRDYQREYMKRRRLAGGGSNKAGSNISEIDVTQMSLLIKKERGLTNIARRNGGFTPIPNIVLNNPAVPRCARATYEAISARAFGKRFSVFASEATLAQDVNVSTRTIIRHLSVLEMLGLIKCIRIGRGMTNTIILTLKMRQAETGSLTRAIQAELGGLHGYVLNRRKLTMREALKLVSERRTRHSLAFSARAILAEAERIMREGK